MWKIDVCHELSWTYVKDALPEVYTKDSGRLAMRILAFLDRWGYVNYGVFQPAPSNHVQSSGTHRCTP